MLKFSVRFSYYNLNPVGQSKYMYGECLFSHISKTGTYCKSELYRPLADPGYLQFFAFERQSLAR